MSCLFFLVVVFSFCFMHFKDELLDTYAFWNVNSSQWLNSIISLIFFLVPSLYPKVSNYMYVRWLKVILPITDGTFIFVCMYVCVGGCVCVWVFVCTRGHLSVCLWRCGGDIRNHPGLLYLLILCSEVFQAPSSRTGSAGCYHFLPAFLCVIWRSELRFFGL